MRGWLVLLACVAAGPVWAAHAYAQFGDVKYPPGFTHFDYVDPKAPKGGEIRMVPPTRPTNFDKFNPFTLQGHGAHGIGLAAVRDPADGQLRRADHRLRPAGRGRRRSPRTAFGHLPAEPEGRFHDGKPVLAADVVHSFKTLTSKEAAPQYRTLYAEVKGATAVDERTVRFDFASPNPELPLVVGGMAVFSREWGKGKPFDQVVYDVPIGSGPYKLASNALGRDVTYARDPAYWAKDQPTRRGHFNFDRITFKIYLDETSRFEGLKAGEFDFMREFISRNWARQYTGKQFETGETGQARLRQPQPRRFPGPHLQPAQAQVPGRARAQGHRPGTRLRLDEPAAVLRLVQARRRLLPQQRVPRRGPPKPDELALLEPLRDKLRPEVFAFLEVSPSTAPPRSLRQNLREAQQLLKDAGWTWRDGALRNAAGEPFVIEYLNDQPSLIRVVGPFQKSLEKLGIQLVFRTVDFSLSKQRMDSLRLRDDVRAPAGQHGPRQRTAGALGIAGAPRPRVGQRLGPGRSGGGRPAAEGRDGQHPAGPVGGHARARSGPHHRLLLGAAVLRRAISWSATGPRRFTLPPKIPPYYDVHDWAMSTWSASPGNR
jgi:microcin C transport system substrate-binding protein